MHFITENNISKMIIYVFIIIMTSMIALISYFYVTNTYEDFDKQMEKYVTQYYKDQRVVLKKEIDTIIDIINYNATRSDINEYEIKQDMIRLLNNISFDREKSNYIFVYEVFNMEGGDNFARMIVNPNRPDLAGDLISTNYEDENGKKFREEFLRNIRLHGESYTQYSYKKAYTNEIKQKLSYFKAYDRWNWVIAAGVYIDDIEEEIAKNQIALQKRIQKQVGQNIFLFAMFLTIAILISIFVSKRIDDVLESYKQKVSANEATLKEWNETLEKKVEAEIEKNREKEQLLVEKARLISLGEMISNIAHQWRQPLSELSSILMFIKFKYNIGQLDKDTMHQKAQEAETVLDFMSHTIDDFRNFFMPKKEKETFVLLSTIDSVVTIVSSALINNNIKISIDIDEKVQLNTFKNEFEQVILNIISNAKDALILKKIEKPWIKVYLDEEKTCYKLFIEDNAGGIQVEPISKIFEPYFSTKKDTDGTGIGLYMSKIIVDKNMNGRLRVRNTTKGAIFGIIIPK